MYIINDYELIEANQNLYLSNFTKAFKIPNETLANILTTLKTYPKLELSKENLAELARSYQCEPETLKTILIEQLHVLKPAANRKFKAIYLNSNDEFISDILFDTFSREYTCEIVPTHFLDYPEDSLVLFFRNNYSDPDFKKALIELTERVYLVTAGVVHKLLIIDNLYFKNSGLPTHYSNYQQLVAYLQSDIPATKNNWLLFYRELFKNKSQGFPDSVLNTCQRAYIAYALNRYLSQFTDFWSPPTPLDNLNWSWHVDLNSFKVHEEIAIHSPFSEFDQKLNLKLTQIENAV